MKQTGSMPLSAIESIIQSITGSILENRLGQVLGSMQRHAFGSLISSLLNAQ
jgi:phage baseplate assembly protein W